MKAYFAVPLVKHRNKQNAKLIAKILNDLGIQIINNWILLDDPNPNLDFDGIYLRDLKAIEKCDIFVAEITKPSTGIGIEIMMAKKFRKKIVCIYKEKLISRMILGMPGITKIKYFNVKDLGKKLDQILSN